METGGSVIAGTALKGSIRFDTSATVSSDPPAYPAAHVAAPGAGMTEAGVRDHGRVEEQTERCAPALRKHLRHRGLPSFLVAGRPRSGWHMRIFQGHSNEGGGIIARKASLRDERKPNGKCRFKLGKEKATAESLNRKNSRIYL